MASSNYTASVSTTQSSNASYCSPNVIPDVLEKLTFNLGLQAISDSIHPFSGLSKYFDKWIKSIEKQVLLHYSSIEGNECIRIALHTSRGAVSGFITRFIKNNDDVTWSQLKQELVYRFGEITDFNTKVVKLRSLTQREGQSVQVFGEIILGKAIETYSEKDIDSPLVQTELTSIFIKGLKSKEIAQKLSRANPENLHKAIKIAVEETQIETRLKAQGLSNKPTYMHEPMEIDQMDKNKNSQHSRAKNSYTSAHNFRDFYFSKFRNNNTFRSHSRNFKNSHFRANTAIPSNFSRFPNSNFRTNREFSQRFRNFQNTSFRTKYHPHKFQNYRTHFRPKPPFYAKDQIRLNNQNANVKNQGVYSKTPKTNLSLNETWINKDTVCFRCKKRGHIRKFCRINLN